MLRLSRIWVAGSAAGGFRLHCTKVWSQALRLFSSRVLQIIKRQSRKFEHPSKAPKPQTQCSCKIEGYPLHIRSCIRAQFQEINCGLPSSAQTQSDPRQVTQVLHKTACLWKPVHKVFTQHVAIFVSLKTTARS